MAKKKQQLEVAPEPMIWEDVVPRNDDEQELIAEAVLRHAPTFDRPLSNAMCCGIGSRIALKRIGDAVYVMGLYTTVYHVDEVRMIDDEDDLAAIANEACNRAFEAFEERARKP